ncbi:MAG: hypothetical protein P9X22_00025 [Candidatus Zapsychrus exili]|nr:hypothetical protein [Candidatus Zapsychrus exili]
MTNNQDAVNYITEFIKNLDPMVRIKTFQKDHYNHHFLIDSKDQSVEIVFGGDTMEDLQEALKGARNSDYCRGFEGSIKFRIYIALGKAGIIPKFSIAKQLLDEKREWKKNIKVSFERQEWLYDIFRMGLNELARFLDRIMENHGPHLEFKKEKEFIMQLLSHYNKNKSFTEREASDLSLGYLKAAAVAVILKKEKERLDIKIPRVLSVKNEEIYNVVDELRKGLFPQIKMPECVFDYAKDIEAVDEVEQVEDGRSGRMSQNVLCGPLAKESCDLLSSIKKNFSDKNVFLDIPYQPNYKSCEAALRSVLSELGFTPIAAKDKLTSNAVLCKVCCLVKTCAFGITDISSGSNSVTYEYGLMHGLGMKACLLLQEEFEKFTDINALEHLNYSGIRNLSIQLTRWLIDNVSDVNLERANALIDRETQAIAASGDIQLPELLTSVAMENGSKSFSENSDISKKYNSEMVGKIKSDLNGKKIFFMTATPIPFGPEIVDISDEKIQGIIKNPSSSRSSGWNMSFYDPSNDITHTFDGIEKQLGELRLRLFRNGYLDFCAIDTNSFSWAMEDKGTKDKILFNPYSITEYPVSFFRLLRELSTILDIFKSFHVSMGFVNQGKYSLRPYSLNNYAHMSDREEKNYNFEDWYFEKSFKALVSESDSDAFTFSERIYNTFGFSRDKIPYFNGEKVFEVKE